MNREFLTLGRLDLTTKSAWLSGDWQGIARSFGQPATEEFRVILEGFIARIVDPATVAQTLSAVFEKELKDMGLKH